VRRWRLPLAIVALAALAIGVLLAAVQPDAPAGREDQARTLAAELRCPDCESLSVAESRTAAAAAIRAEIEAQLAAGRSPADIRASFVARYGEWILLQPTSPLIWLVPVIALLAGVVLLGWWLLGRRAESHTGDARPPTSVPVAPPAERDRIRQEAADLDG
jgi:cytochrome c-type biogenesis protein CcmH